MADYVENLVEKPITEFEPGQTIYIKKMLPSGHSITMLCEFVSFQRGIVTGKVIKAEPDWAPDKFKPGHQVTARLGKCYLYGHLPDDPVDWPTCHWFDAKTRRVK